MSAENNVNESKPLEVPEVVPGAAAVEFPEINDFLSRMRIRSGLFGFQKEDVFAKMQELNTLYQNRLQQMRDQTRGQLKQMKKQYQEEAEEFRVREQQEREQLLEEARGKF